MDESSCRTLTAEKDSFSQNCGQVMNIAEYKQLHQQRLGYYSREQEFKILDLASFALKKGISRADVTFDLIQHLHFILLDPAPNQFGQPL
jgi:hypothetical protein